jgi:hypothetical protein
LLKLALNTNQSFLWHNFSLFDHSRTATRWGLTYIAAGNSHRTPDQFDGIKKLLISACVYENETRMTTWKRHRNGGKRFGALKSDSTHHFFRNACTKSGSLRFSQFSGGWLILSVYILMSFDFPFVRLFGVR